MTLFIRPIVLIPFCAALLGAAAVPEATERPELNLQHYLEYRMDGKIALTCEAKKSTFVCLGRDHRRDRRECHDGHRVQKSVAAFQRRRLRSA